MCYVIKFDHLITIFIVALLAKKGRLKYGRILGLRSLVANLGGLPNFAQSQELQVFSASQAVSKGPELKVGALDFQSRILLNLIIRP